MAKKQINVPPPMDKKIRKLMKETGVSYTEIVRRLIDRGLDVLKGG